MRTLPLSRLAAAALLLACCACPQAQRVVTGLVLDAGSGEPVPFAAVQLPDGRGGVGSDLHGRFAIEVPGDVNVLRVSCIGFRPAMVTVSEDDHLVIRLQPAVEQLPAVDIRPGVNPALALIEGAIARRHLNHGLGHRAHRYRSYARTVFTLGVDSALLADTTRARFPEG